jgi:hypothetical protein
MCFEWDERYRREQAMRQSKEKVDELFRSATEAANAESANVPVNEGKQSVDERQDMTA